MGTRSDVYFNLHRRCFSVRQGGRVQAHSDLVVLRDCTFVVQPAGLRRVRETGVKNVHAFVRGDVQDVPEGWLVDVENIRRHSAWQVRYNPRVHDSFMRQMYGPRSEQPIKEADLVVCEIRNNSPLLWAWTPRKVA